MEENTDRLRVLVVDDELGMRLGMTRCIEGLRVEVPEVRRVVGFEIQAAEDGQSALDAIDAFAPDILLLDYKLPDMTGLEILQKVSERKLDILTVMVTAYATLETAIVATRQGAFDFLAKPYNPGELRVVVQKAARHLVLGRQARKLEEEKHRVRFQFISVLAHELKSPLSAVEGYLYLLQDPKITERPEVVRQCVDRSLVRLGGMRKLVADLLDMTRLESGEKLRELKSVDLVAVAREALEGVEEAAREKHLRFDVELPERILLMADPGEMSMILNNLLSNAIKYNREGGSVRLRLSEAMSGDLQELRVEVADTGIGMSAEDQARLFKEFSRIKNSRTNGILGSGLGLSIVKKVVELYHGRVSVQSEPDVGSTFTVHLPASALLSK